MTLAIIRTEVNYPVEKDIKNTLNCWEMSFFSSFKIFTENAVWTRWFARIKRRYYKWYFFFVSWSQEKGICIWIRSVVCVMFWWKFDIRICFLSYRIEVITKDITHCCRICNGFGTVAVIFLIEITVLIPFQVFLMLFQLFSKYFA